MKLKFLFTFFFLLAFFTAEGKIIDSLMQKIEEAKLQKNWDANYTHWIALAEQYQAEENYTKGIDLLDSLLHDFKIDNYPIHKARILLQLGMNYQRQNLYQKALAAYQSCLELKIEGQVDIDAEAYAEMSSIYQSLGNYQRAFELQMLALGIREQSNDSIGIARSNYILGTIFFYQDRFEQAHTYYEKAYSIFKNSKETRQIYACLAAIGSVYFRLNDFEKSKYYSEQSLALAESIQYKTGIAYSLGNLASIHIERKEYPAAERLFQQAITLKREVGDTWGVIGSSVNQADMYNRWSKPHLAIPILKEMLSTSQHLKTKPRILECYKNLSRSYELQNKKGLAHKYLKMFVALQDSVLSEKTLEEMGQSKRRYELESKEYEIELLKQKNQLLGKDKEIQKLQNYGAVLLLVLLSLIGIWFWNRYKVQGRLNNLLAEKNDLLNSKNEEIFVKNKLLEQSNLDLSQFAYVASHDLKEPLRMIHSYTSLLEKRYAHAFDESGLEFMHFITDAVGRMKILLDDLLEFSRAGKADQKGENLDVNDILTMAEANLRHRFETSNASLIIHKENMPVVQGQRTHLIQLLQNLISNGVKFKREGVDPEVVINCKQDGEQYIFSITDNGIGIAEEHQEKVFEMFRRLHTREEFEGTGIGLATCKRIVNGLGGDIWLESEVGKGTTIYFTLPATTAVPEMA